MLLSVTDFPIRVFVLSLLLLAGSLLTSHALFRRGRALEPELRETFSLIQGASLTLLALFVGFSFSMAIAHYDARASAEEAETQAIQTAYLRLDFLPVSEAHVARFQLEQYLDLRVQFYQLRTSHDQQEASAQASLSGRALWHLLTPALTSSPDALTASLGNALTEVLGTAGLSSSAWQSRMPPEAWVLMLTVALGCCVLAGYGAQHTRKGAVLTLMLPVVIAFSFMLIADIDSTQSGVIYVMPDNLSALSLSLGEDPVKRDGP